MPEGSMACSLANDVVWYDGKEDFLKILPPLMMFTMHRLNSDLTLVLYSDFADLCCHVTESKGKMLDDTSSHHSFESILCIAF